LRTRACRAARTSDSGKPNGTFFGNDSQPGFELDDHRINRWRLRGLYDSRLELGLRLGLGVRLALGLRRRASALFDISKLTHRGEIVRCGLEDVFELADRLVVPPHFQEGAAEGNPS